MKKVIILSKAGQYLNVMGVEHINNPKHEQFNELRRYWKNFLKKTSGKDRLVCVEGRLRSVATDELSAIAHGGEADWIAFAAHQAEVKAVCPEPDGSKERQELLKLFAKEEIQYYYFARIVHQWHQIPEPKPDFKKYIHPFLKSDKKEARWNDFPFTLDAMKRIHDDLFKTDFNYNDAKFFAGIVNPYYPKRSAINRIAQRSGEIRDEQMLKNIKSYWNKGKSLFIVFGSWHVINLEPEIRKLIS